MELRPEQFKLMLPLPVTVITTVDGQGVANAAPYGCVMPILRPLDLVAIASALPRHTLHNIRETGEFVINVIGAPSFEKAMLTARNYPTEVDELKEVGLDTSPSRTVAPPRIDDALGWIEATLEREIAGKNYSLVIGKVLYAEINDRFCRDGRLAEPPALMLSPYYHLMGGRIGDARETMKLFLGDQPPRGGWSRRLRAGGEKRMRCVRDTPGAQAACKRSHLPTRGSFTWLA